MSASKQPTDPIHKLAELIKDIRIAMLTTKDENGALRSRPMATQLENFDGELWFFTRAHDGKAEELSHDHHVNLSYAMPEKQRYVSITGLGEVVRDQARMRTLWNPAYRAWFPDGLDDPSIALLKVSVEKAEYWDTPSSKMVHLIGAAKAVVTGRSYKPGNHEKLEIDPRLH